MSYICFRKGVSWFGCDFHPQAWFWFKLIQLFGDSCLYFQKYFFIVSSVVKPLFLQNDFPLEFVFLILFKKYNRICYVAGLLIENLRRMKKNRNKLGSEYLNFYVKSYRIVSQKYFAFHWYPRIIAKKQKFIMRKWEIFYPIKKNYYRISIIISFFKGCRQQYSLTGNWNQILRDWLKCQMSNLPDFVCEMS